ncbi:Hypothetical predicted protein [Paramuricea clavata]|uniref:Uncharacterized protein n=1 Tax=Paramuricea clavata TaxID=317549 RepID=A0A7D9EKA3_PARCT|nr:Hypothetical predicted protein [Paramuricea clavata]
MANPLEKQSVRKPTGWNTFYRQVAPGIIQKRGPEANIGKVSTVGSKMWRQIGERRKCFFAETVQPSVGDHSCNSLNIPAEIEDLKSGQLVNGEAIKALNSCDDSTNASTSTNAQLGADGIASDQVTVIDLCSRPSKGSYFSEGLIGWFASYLRGRSQISSHHGVKSERMEINEGVPQGSILGPIAFVIKINQLPSITNWESAETTNQNYTDEGETTMFMDDTTLSEVIKVSDHTSGTLFGKTQKNDMEKQLQAA